ncbi:50S ribosomal protein L10 [bacterium]|nr:50S ribosomal protein L10 [bacterium]
MATSRAKKSQTMEEVKAILEKNRNIVLAEYRGLNVKEMTEMRMTMRKTGIKFRILKNTLAKKIFQAAGISNLEEYLQGPVGIGFLGEDVSVSAKTVLKFAKKKEFFIVKAAHIEGQVMELGGFQAIASLPSREVILSTLLGTLQAPIRGFMTVAEGNTRKLVYALNALKEQKEKQAA